MNKQGIREQFTAILGRNDITQDLANTFIDQAVSRIQRTLRVPAMEKIAEYTIELGQVSLTLPQDFMNMKFFYSGQTLLEYLPIGAFLARGSCTGAPKVYTRVGGELRLSPLPTEGTALTLVYYGEVPDLVEDTDTNFLSEIAPDLLVYGALTFAADFYLDERKQVFEDSFNRIYQEMTEQALLVEMEQSAMAVAPAYDTEY